MLALGVLLGDRGVAGAAVHLLGDRVAGPGQGDVHPGVALRAGDLGVAGGLVLLLVHEHRPPVASPSRRLLLVALQAVRVRHALRVEDLAHLVRLVAVDARGQDVGLLLPELPLDDLPVDGLDLGVALRAGLRDVAAGDRGPGVGVGQDVVGGVAGGAVRGDDEALLEEALAVDRLRVVLQDVVLVDVALPHDDRALLVALAAGEGHLERRDRGEAGPWPPGCRGRRGRRRRSGRASRPASSPCRGARPRAASSPSSWQAPQSTFWRGASWGSSLPARSAWQLTHSSPPWIEPAKAFSAT